MIYTDEVTNAHALRKEYGERSLNAIKCLNKRRQDEY